MSCYYRAPQKVALEGIFFVKSTTLNRFISLLAFCALAALACGGSDNKTSTSSGGATATIAAPAPNAKLVQFVMTDDATASPLVNLRTGSTNPNAVIDAAKVRTSYSGSMT